MALVVKSAVRNLLKGMRASEDFWKAIDAVVTAEVKKAIERAKANGRKTVRAADLWIFLSLREKGTFSYFFILLKKLIRLFFHV